MNITFILVGLFLSTVSISGEGSFFNGTVVLAQTSDVSEHITDLYQNSVFTVNAYVEREEPSSVSEQSDRHFFRNVGTAFSFGSGEYLVTLFWVTKNAKKITVVSSSGEMFDASLIGTKQSSRISVLKIDQADSYRPPHVECEDSTPPGSDIYVLCLNKNEIAINPAVVSKNRPQDGTFIIDARETTATSGAPVFDANARLLGLLALQIEDNPTEPQRQLSLTDDNPPKLQSFVVIPADYAWVVAQSLINEYKGECGWLGISGDIIGNPEVTGVIIRRVVAGSPAEQSGLRKNDRVVWLNDVPIASFRHLVERLSMLRAGETVDVTIVRGDESLKIPVILGPYPSNGN